MEIKVKASTKNNYIASKDELDEISGNAAGVCYMPVDFEKLNEHSAEHFINLASRTKASVHHSTCGHPHITFQISGIPKLFAMLINNENLYETSEKSARYTKMNFEGLEFELYEKWKAKFVELITKEYGNETYFTEKRINKLAMENARYMTSIMTPTSMEYTVSYQQLNYLCNWMTKLKNETNELYKLLIPTCEDFVANIKAMGYLDEDLMDDAEGRGFSLVAKRARQEQFGEMYSINYKMSFAMFANAERHRTLNYELSRQEKKEYFVPKLLRENNELVDEWLTDMNRLADANIIPQGELVNINERGSYEKLISKCRKRLCTCAQQEIMEQTNENVKRYIAETDDEYVKSCLEKIVNKSRCLTGFTRCSEPCAFKEGLDLTRKI